MSIISKLKKKYDSSVKNEAESNLAYLKTRDISFPQSAIPAKFLKYKPSDTDLGEFTDLMRKLLMVSSSNTGFKVLKILSVKIISRTKEVRIKFQHSGELETEDENEGLEVE